MKIHTIFVEPANYTQDLIYNVHQKFNINYSFLKSNSLASFDNEILTTAKHVFDRKKWYTNITYLWNLSLENKLVIVNGYSNLTFIILWVFSIKNSCFIGIESDTPYYKIRGVKGIIKKWFLNLFFLNSKILGLPGGSGLHRDLFLEYGISSNKIFLLPMMVGNEKYFKIAKAFTSDQITTISFIYVGRLIQRKNVKLLCASFKTLLKDHINIELNIIGDGECMPELIDLVKHTPQIILHGKKFDNDLLQFYEGANVLILPATDEPWGLVINEAMAAGLPVVCSSAVGAAHDLVLKPDTGWVFEDNNEQDLTAVLLNIIENPEQIKEKAIRAQEFMMNYWNYDLYKASLNQIIDYVKKA
jgi:glycosyltransferase involved in cell wall biosynthesis